MQENPQMRRIRGQTPTLDLESDRQVFGSNRATRIETFATIYRHYRISNAGAVSSWTSEPPLNQLSLLRANFANFSVLRPGKPHKYRKAVSKERVVKTYPLPGAKISSKIVEHHVFAQSRPPKVPRITSRRSLEPLSSQRPLS
jgi:hypothetical protein